MKHNSRYSEIKNKSLTAKLNESSNTWLVFRPNGRKIGWITANYEAICFSDQYTPINAKELNALVDILDRVYEKMRLMKQLSIEIDGRFQPYSDGIKSVLSELRYIRRNWPGSKVKLMLTTYDPATFSYTDKPKIKTIVL